MDNPNHLETPSALDENEFWQTFKEIYKNTPLPFDVSKFREVPEDSKAFLSKMLPLDKENPTMYDFMELLLSFSEDMQNDSKSYNEIRNHAFKHLNQGKYDAQNETIDFNEAFRGSAFQTTFVEYVKTTIHSINNGPISDYGMHVQSYNLLDMFGISKDRIQQRNGFNNILNDGIHSYYATYCDYLVTDDKGMKRKSKTLYNLYNIHTKVVSVQEFLDILPQIGTDTERNVQHFVDKFIRDINTTKQLEHSIQDDGTITISHKLPETYFNFFDTVHHYILTTGKTYMVYTKEESKHLLAFPNYREIEALVNKCVTFFGVDKHSLGFFDFEKERDQMHENKWAGRIWVFNDILFYLFINSTLESVCFQIEPINQPSLNTED